MQVKNEEGLPQSQEEMLAFIERRLPVIGEKLKRLLDKEAFLKSGNVYGEIYSNRQLDICFGGILRTEYLRCRILGAIGGEAISVKQIAERIGLKPNEVLREVVELRRRNLVAIEKIDDRTPLYRAVG